MRNFSAASLFLFFLVSVQAQSLPSTVTQAFKKSQIPLDAISVYVQEVTSPPEALKPIVSWQAEQLFQPATTMKLVTSYVALDISAPSPAQREREPHHRSWEQFG